MLLFNFLLFRKPNWHYCPIDYEKRVGETVESLSATSRERGTYTRGEEVDEMSRKLAVSQCQNGVHAARLSQKACQRECKSLIMNKAKEHF